MKKMKKISVLCAALLVFAMAFEPLMVSADTKQQYMNAPMNDKKEYLYSYIQTNFYAASSPGVTFRSTKDDAIRLFGLTKEDLDAGANPIMFVDDADYSGQPKKDADAFAANFGGTVMSVVDVQFWVYHGIGTWTERVTKTLDEKVKLAFGVNEEYVDSGAKTVLLDGTKEFAVLSVRDGVVTLYDDVDTDLRSVTIETNQDAIFALVYAPTGSIAAYKASQTSTATDSGKKPSSSDMDEVPKTGEDTKTDKVKEEEKPAEEPVKEPVEQPAETPVEQPAELPKEVIALGVLYGIINL